MKIAPFILALLIAPLTWDAAERLSQRHDTDPEYIVNGLSKLETQNTQGEYEPHVGSYNAKGKLSYCTSRIVLRTVTARPTRRIVQRLDTPQGPSRKLIFIFPVVNPSASVRQTRGISEDVHVTVELPGPDVLPPGKNYLIESAIEFPSHGEREAQTYTSDTQPFDVE